MSLLSVSVEVSLTAQIPQFTLVGLASSQLQESRDRVRAAVGQSRLPWPDRRITANLVPTELPKWGSHFDLALALGILWAQDQEKDSLVRDKEVSPGGPLLKEETSKVEDEASPKMRVPSGRGVGLHVFALGELSLSGEVKALPWFSTLGPSSLGGQGWERLVREASLILLPKSAADLWRGDPRFIGVDSLVEAWSHLRNQWKVVETKTQAVGLIHTREEEEGRVLSSGSLDVGAHCWGQTWRFLETVRAERWARFGAWILALDGRLHGLLAGPQGSGKTMVAKALALSDPLFPDFVQEHSKWIQLMKQGDCETKDGWVWTPDGRDGSTDGGSNAVWVHSSVSREGLIGSVDRWGQVLPGAMTQAHGARLVVDEFLECRRDALESLRQPLQEGVVWLHRAQRRQAFPANFQLIATTNLCPCGSWLSQRALCRCSPVRRRAYQTKLSGPLLDRFTVVLLMGVDADEWIGERMGERAHKFWMEVWGRWETMMSQSFEKKDTLLRSWKRELTEHINRKDVPMESSKNDGQGRFLGSQEGRGRIGDLSARGQKQWELLSGTLEFITEAALDRPLRDTEKEDIKQWSLVLKMPLRQFVEGGV